MEKTRPLKFARKLRQEQTPAEKKLWGALRKRTLSGYRFNRQFTVGPYVADFVCREKALIIEVDGATHGDASEIAYDERRTCFLVAQGYQVYRVTNTDVFENLSGVLDGLFTALESLPNTFHRKAPLSPSDRSPNKLGER